MPAAQATKKKSRATSKTAKAGGIGSEAVAKKTGRSWDQWFTLLDKAGAKKMQHKEIATLLHERHGVPAWWAQMVTVGYEQERLGRQKHQRPDGYEISVSKTVPVGIARLYKAWSDKRARARWLGESDLTIRRATKEKSLRITWVDGTTYVDADFYPKGADKSRITVQHRKLTAASAAAKAKKDWTRRLAALAQHFRG